MTTPLRALLDKYRHLAPTERDKGTYLEKLSVVFIKNDATMQSQYDDAWLFADWAKLHKYNGKDTGIDVVASIKDSSKFCAIQCKFYAQGATIQKGDLDSFFTASGTHHFEQRMFIDTTDKAWGANAEDALENQQIEVKHIGISALEASNIDWSTFHWEDDVKIHAKKEMRPHQIDALAAVKKGLQNADRGKVIMACGTGKTFTALKFAEDSELAGVGKRVLYLVPSLALMSQTIREWHNDSKTTLRSFAVCSDAEVGKRRISKDDIAEISASDLEIPATTHYVTLAKKAKHETPEKLTVIFSTYHSIQTIADAQLHEGLPPFDLIICDEAHRTTGATLEGDDESAFVRVHDNTFINAKKRIYMTATPRVYTDAVKSKASEVSAILYSMDDEIMFGKDLFVRGFGWAVENDLLTDYKVLVLAIDEGMVSQTLQNRLKDGSSELVLDDATKIIGCYKALTKYGLKDDLNNDPHPMRRALAFCQTIKASKLVTKEFGAATHDFLASDLGKESMGDAPELHCELNHVDGTMGAQERGKFLDWLKEDTNNSCRILSNAKCLSEGVDVPALDAIMFMHPRKSQIDIVQSVGRVMRRAEGKKMGYIILPIGVPAGMSPEEALNDNERYRVVWQILNALRSHDERLDARLNQADLGVDITSNIEVIAFSNQLPSSNKKEKEGMNLGHGGGTKTDDDDGAVSTPKPKHEQTAFVFDEFSKAIMAKIVKKCGRRDYWENWANDIAKIAQTHITRIKAIIAEPDTTERKAFDAFLAEIRDDLNESISPEDAIEMLAQHLITKPVFDALFEGYSFTQNNPVSMAMSNVLETLHEHNLEKETATLEKFYESVKRRASGIDSAEAKQKIVVELYDKFFRTAFPRMTEKLGIVYTPVEVVDFIIHSVNDALMNEFGQTLGSKGVHILDPFTGTGTFITRLLQSGLIKPEELEHKFKNEIHANEIVLLAYYIAAINIEAAYHSIQGGDYTPFEGICLTDTFQLYEQEKDMVSELMTDNSNRRTRQKELDIRVIMGNPPYSAGQKSANDDNANIKYPNLDTNIEATYAKYSRATNQQNLYDSYIRAIRWASDKIGNSGVIAYVSGAAWSERGYADGLRKCLKEEFSNIYVIRLRGDIRKNMLSKGKAGEGENIFEHGSMTGISIAVLVKNDNSKECGKIYSYDIGKNKKRKEKLDTISNLKSINGITNDKLWEEIISDEFNDWFDKRDSSFNKHINIGDKKDKNQVVIFENYTTGLTTNRDAWCYNSSICRLTNNIKSSLEFYNRALDNHANSIGEQCEPPIDLTKISWTRSLKRDFSIQRRKTFSPDSIVFSAYRPFSQMSAYYNKEFNEYLYQIPKIFPTGKEDNMVIALSGTGAQNDFSCLLTKNIPDLHFIQTGQTFPLHLYDAPEADGLFAGSNEYKRRDAITNEGLKHFQDAYKGETITKEDIFFYIYGLLHSEDYRARFADNLSKQLPRIPCVKTAKDFWAFEKAGRELGDMHVNFETYDQFPIQIKQGSLDLAVINDPVKYFRVEKMKYGGKVGDKDKSTIIYNHNITIQNIPLEAYDYVVNGKPAIDWVVERQCVKTDKDSGIVNDANDYANETMNNPRYPLELLARVINISLSTMEIVRNLPKLEI